MNLKGDAVKANIPKSVEKFMDEIRELCGEEHKEWALNFNHSYIESA